MKKLLLLVLLCGCVTYVPDPTSKRITAIAQSSALATVKPWLNDHPADRQKFVEAVRILTTLIDHHNNDPAALALALKDLPINSFMGPGGETYVSLITLVVWDGAFDECTAITGARTGAAMLGLRNGIALALKP